MPNPKKESLTAIIAELRDELGQARTERDAAVEATKDATRTASDRAEEDAGRIASLKAICGEKDAEIAELKGYIRRVHEEDDSTSPLGEKQPAPEVPRTRLARESGANGTHSIHFLGSGWSRADAGDGRRHWSTI